MKEDDGIVTITNPSSKSVAFGRSYVVTKSTKSKMKFRRKNYHNFQLCYTELCSMHNIPMIFPIKAHLHKRMLDFNADRVKIDEWRPILKALSLDRSLHLIAIRSKNSCSKVLEHVDSETKSRKIAKLPVLFTNFIFKRLVTSLGRTLSYNTQLKCLELDGLLLSGDYLETLLSGLEKTSSLQHLSLHRCPLGDDGCQLVCTTLRNLPNILTVDMSGCNLSSKGAFCIAKMLQYQNLNRYGENWKQSLRCRIPDTEMMPGLRRVTLNHNPLIGDCGVGHIISVLRDDLWLKALDLQNVGLTNKVGMEILDMLHVNKTVSILDVHNNPELDQTIFESIMNVLANTNVGKPSEYHWIREDAPYLPRKPSYQSRDPSSTLRPLKGNDLSNSGWQPLQNDARHIRLTKSSVIPSVACNQMNLNKAYSTPAVMSTNFKLMDKTTGRGFQGQQSRRREDLPLNNYHVTNWDHTNAGGDGYNVYDTRAKLQELTSKLEEEIQKRQEAEEQKADLELKLKHINEEHNKTMNGHVLMDSRVVHEITEAFAAFTGFLAIFDKGGLQLGSLNGSDSTLVSSESLPQSFCHQTTSEELNKVSSPRSSVLSISLKESSSNWKTESETTTSSSNGSRHSLIAESDKCRNHNSKCTRANADKDDAKTSGDAFNVTSPRDDAGEIEQCQASDSSEVPNKTFQLADLGLQLKRMLKTNAVTFLSHREKSLSQKFIKRPIASTPRSTGSESSQSGSTVVQTESSESVYTNAYQMTARDD